jgi:hypothetical protein
MAASNGDDDLVVVVVEPGGMSPFRSGNMSEFPEVAIVVAKGLDAGSELKLVMSAWFAGGFRAAKYSWAKSSALSWSPPAPITGSSFKSISTGPVRVSNGVQFRLLYSRKGLAEKNCFRKESICLQVVSVAAVKSAALGTCVPARVYEAENTPTSVGGGRATGAVVVAGGVVTTVTGAAVGSCGGLVPTGAGVVDGGGGVTTIGDGVAVTSGLGGMTAGAGVEGRAATGIFVTGGFGGKITGLLVTGPDGCLVCGLGVFPTPTGALVVGETWLFGTTVGASALLSAVVGKREVLGWNVGAADCEGTEVAGTLVFFNFFLLFFDLSFFTFKECFPFFPSFFFRFCPLLDSSLVGKSEGALSFNASFFDLLLVFFFFFFFFDAPSPGVLPFPSVVSGSLPPDLVEESVYIDCGSSPVPVSVGSSKYSKARENMLLARSPCCSRRSTSLSDSVRHGRTTDRHNRIESCLLRCCLALFIGWMALDAGQISYFGRFINGAAHSQML